MWHGSAPVFDCSSASEVRWGEGGSCILHNSTPTLHDASEIISRLKEITHNAISDLLHFLQISVWCSYNVFISINQTKYFSFSGRLVQRAGDSGVVSRIFIRLSSLYRFAVLPDVLQIKFKAYYWVPVPRCSGGVGLSDSARASPGPWLQVCERDLKPYMTSTDGLQVELPRNRSLVLVTFPLWLTSLLAHTTHLEQSDWDHCQLLELENYTLTAFHNEGI